MGRRFVIEADGGSRGNPGPAGYGAVVKDAVTGEVLAETAEFIGHATNNVAEYRGLVAGLHAARELDPEASVHVLMDSKLVVEQMSGRWKIKHPAMRPLAAEAREIFPLDAVRYEWVPRARNSHADRLANEAMDAGRRGEQWRPSGVPEPAAAPSREDVGVTAPAAPPPGWSADLGAPTTFVLLRHGETALTPQKRFSGSGGDDPELSEAGRRQAEAAATALAARGTVQAVVSSPLRRCQETAAAVAARLGLDVRTEDGLREAAFGAWEGLTFAEVRERHPEDLDAWLASDTVAPTGGGESFADVARRVAVARDKLVARYAGRTVLLVTHVTPVKTLVRLALGAPPESLFRMELSAASLSAVAYYADGNASLRLLNDTSHLR
ncbi:MULTISPECIES: bifunctional RNase H/acid phosphatase [unclassified Streptomyces]|uniref:bifunctional RNase H/acid phosphatase n=1 Tax=unclassified Streptomyces TaxID=2593676 RepID=UPI0022B73940|nr:MULTISPECIES: bifunctional RNase H/acid phosphatase [unclassified Streptomyces]MCZ7414021.1 bifunctional RNase H/acid phosphatase [Streptomyces sp. WMMC897]MCZ7431017.1 bifunctional RNase H/acid phosphatase [Streptomyces sp. WMMC1477]